ncbi:roadblock/LC7 domain-containing protein [Streptomyces sp. NPDC059802]|uniref:roadblock/LC7 domain-containing protein n=1 Tax=Streptomyces sp. NPDC059802 TaxID=3346952 RepID=UPI0036502288
MTQHTTELTALGQLLADFVNRVPGVEVAVLVTSDGLAKEHAGLSDKDADRLAAGVSGLASLSSGVFDGAPGKVQQTAIEHDSGALFIMRADGPHTVPHMIGALLAVRTTATADMGAVGYEMRQWIEQMYAHLLDPVRSAPLAAGPGVTRPVQ